MGTLDLALGEGGRRLHPQPAGARWKRRGSGVHCCGAEAKLPGFPAAGTAGYVCGRANGGAVARACVSAIVPDRSTDCADPIGKRHALGQPKFVGDSDSNRDAIREPIHDGDAIGFCDGVTIRVNKRIRNADAHACSVAELTTQVPNLAGRPSHCLQSKTTKDFRPAASHWHH